MAEPKMITRRTVLGSSALLASSATLLTSPATASNGSLNEAGFQTLGEIDQWVSIRGRSARNPVVLIIHGGPGEAQSPLSALYTSDWEKFFTVVQWDQRGSGRTFGRNREADLSAERLVHDGIELGERLKNRFGRRPILIGHSWGSYLAGRIAKSRPDLFTALVGTGQLSSWRRLIRDELAFATARAQATANAEALAALQALNADALASNGPYFDLRRWLNLYLAPTDIAWSDAMHHNIEVAAGMTPQDAKDWQEGLFFSFSRLGSTVSQIDMSDVGFAYDIPYVLLHGRDDYVASAKAAMDYFNKVRAPSKRARLIDGGHYAMMTHSNEFLRNLVRHTG
ncbi:alpha/beta hydrolase [Sphingomonas mali]|uniref:alpha/beta hydrolase n=1 Tax=Sphingomonas mali TaxID=40682 RepID=UPI000A489FDF|nr:alpha/beta hydrolase [Sphingomonas mali]